MKKLLVLFVVVIGATCMTANIAVAGSGQKTIQFTTAYPEVGVTCKGQRIVTTGTNASVRDRETCVVTDQSLFPAGTYPIAPLAHEDFPNSISWDGVRRVLLERPR